MAVSKYKMVRFFKRYILKGMLICLLCVSSILSLTACCYPTSVTRSAERVEGVDEQDYLNSMFSGAIALTSLSTKELVKDYKFYDEQSVRTFDSSGLNSFYDYADRQFTAMAQYLSRALQGIYGDCEPEGEFLWMEWDNCYDILNPAWYRNDPNACYSNDIWAYYYTALLNNPTLPHDHSLASFPLSHNNYMFHYACAGFENLNYDFTNQNTVISSLLTVYTNAKNYTKAKYKDSGYQSNSEDSSGYVQIAPIYVGGQYHYYVMATEKNDDGSEKYPYSGNTHLYDVMNANWGVTDADDHEQFTIFGWNFGSRYDRKPKEKRDFYDDFADDDFVEHLDEVSDFVGWSFDNNEPNVKNIIWRDDHYEYDYGLQLSNSDYNGSYFDIYAPIEYNGQSTGTKRYYIDKEADLTDSAFFGLVKWDDGDWGYVRSGSSSGAFEGYYIRGGLNTYIILENVKTANNIPLDYIEFNQAYFPLSCGHKYIVGSVDQHWKTSGLSIIFDEGGTPEYVYENGKAYMRITIKSTTDITGVFNHRRYFTTRTDTNGVNTMTKWAGHVSGSGGYNSSNALYSVQKLKFALAAINRYGGYANAKAVKTELGSKSALHTDMLNSNTYYYHILGTKSIGLNQFLYDGIMDYLMYDVIGVNYWNKSLSAFDKYFDSSGTELYATVFAANTSKQELSYYKGYDVVVPRIVGSLFCLINADCDSSREGTEGNPFVSSSMRNTICNKLYASYTNVGSDFAYSDLGSNEYYTLFPSLIASRIYTYGDVSTLNRMYNYQNGIDWDPGATKEEVGHDEVIHEDRVGAYKHYYDDEGNEYTELKTLYEYLYGVEAKNNVMIDDVSYDLEEHEGVFDVVTEYRIQSLILFPKLTLAPGKSADDYGEYINVDPTFIMSAVGATSGVNTYVRMSTEIAGSYTKQGVDEDDPPKRAAGNSRATNIVYGTGRSYSHDTVETEENVTDGNNNSYITANATKYLHVKGNDFYTDVAIMVTDEVGNSVRNPDTNMPIYYKTDEILTQDAAGNARPSYGELAPSVTPGVTNPAGTIKLYDNYTREVYMYTEDYLYFQKGTRSSHDNYNFYLYKYNGSKKEINSNYFIDKYDESIAGLDVGPGVKYDPYKLRSSLFISAPDGWVLNTEDIGAYIKIDFTYWQEETFVTSKSPTIGFLKNLANDITAGFVEVDSFSDFWTNFKQFWTNLGDIISGSASLDRSYAHNIGTNYEGDVGYVLDTDTTGVRLFEISIHVRDCGAEKMLEQGPEDFPIDMHGDYVVTYQAYDGTFIHSQAYNDMGDGNDGYYVTNTSAFLNAFNTSQYADFTIDEYIVNGTAYSLAQLRSTIFYTDINVVVKIDLPDYDLTYNYKQVVLNGSYMSWTAFKSQYSSLLSNATKNKTNMSSSYPYLENSVIPLEEKVDLGDSFEVTSWRVFDTKYTGNSISSQSYSYTTVDPDASITLNTPKTVVPVIRLSSIKIKMMLNGGNCGSYADTVEFDVQANTALSENSTAYSAVSDIVNNISHPLGYDFAGWKVTDDYTGNLVGVSGAEILDTVFEYKSITYVATWDLDMINFSASYIHKGSSSEWNADGSLKSSSVINSIDVSYFEIRNADLGSPKNEALKNKLDFSSDIAKFIQYGSNYYYFLGYTTKTSFSGTLTSGYASLAPYTVLYSNNAVTLSSSYYTNNRIIVPSKYNHLDFTPGTEAILHSLYIGTHAINFNNKGTVSTMHIMKGTSANDGYKNGSIPNITDSNFIGWTTNSDVDNFTIDDIDTLIDPTEIMSTVFTGNQTYYAVYNNVKVEFKDTVRNVSLGTYYYLKGSKVDSVPSLPSGASCWSTSNSSKSEVDFSTYVLNSSNVTFYACYEYTISYYYHDSAGNEKVATRSIYNNNSAANLSTGNASFKHWSTSAGGKTAVDLSTVKGRNQSLYAVYEYVVSYSGITSGVSNPSSQTITASYNENAYSISLPISANYSYETATHIYTFEGWTWSGSATPVSSATITSSVSFTAKYTVTEKPTEP